MIHKESSLSSASSVCEFDIGFGEILDYHEDGESDGTITFKSPWEPSSSSSTGYEDDLPISSFDGKGKGKAPAHKIQPLDRYHPENSKREVIDRVSGSTSSVGEINASDLNHSSERWSNYHDLCESVTIELQRRGYEGATVECVSSGTGRQIKYKLC
ncbi:protein of unknown function [Taphrina deformans PYCC 5710]|uniref:Uncharacterized protein n=1 Tax=Taphrina deformans (strain PYCC 5710 / ATCC 11124 / CBS 356.35 / IMI 108563 / JCM 9778 / NBRC 8474) TaxID=1097556 RepID=R4XAR0_TAPDE|nr:protein of unknown function [Taphrina deformans PYCC 5710]|eukprot:CCG81408.1 protein of unknown function [Taphrina deformans PYCC 5710]